MPGLTGHLFFVMPDLIGHLFFVMPDLIGHLYNHRIHHHPFI
jgi:hypothetical protein